MFFLKFLCQICEKTVNKVLEVTHLKERFISILGFKRKTKTIIIIFVKLNLYSLGRLMYGTLGWDSLLCATIHNCGHNS